MNHYTNIKTMAELNALENPVMGDIYYCEETKHFYKYNNEKKHWDHIKLNGQGLSMSLYDLNKNIIEQLPSMTTEQIYSKRELFTEYLNENVDNYHMLLCREYNYYTLFVHNYTLEEDFEDIIIEMITELGEVKAIDREENKTLSIWIKTNDDNEVKVFYLFPYDRGVVYYA